MKFKPLWPFSDKEVGLGWFTARNPQINRVLAKLGAIVFTLALLIKAGILSIILESLKIFIESP